MGVGADNNFKDNVIEDNIVANNRDMGIRLNAFKNTAVRNNVIYNNDPQIAVEDNKGPSSNNSIEDNLVYSLSSDQIGLSMTHDTEHGQSNNNFFCNPYNTLMGVRDGKYYDLGHWQNAFKKLDQNSRTCNFNAREYITEETGNNLITNTTFDSDVNDWKGSITYDPNKAEMDSGSLKFEGSKKTNFLIYPSFELQADQFYRLRFSVIGNGFGSLQMRTNDTSEKYSVILEEQFYPFDKTRHDYEFTFQATRSTPDGQLLFITREHDEKIYWVDNVSLYPVNAQLVAKTEQSKLVMNPTDNTQQIKLPTGVEFFDLQGQSVSGQITLEPYSATVLVRTDDNISPSEPYLNLMQNGRRVTASWAPIVGATGYRLYYAEYPNAPEIFNIDMGEQRRLSVDLPQGSAFYVAVAAYNGFGESGYSNIRFFIVKQ
jgi:parallel beta-helix repeat protein